jgi:hypothetical protein
MSALPRRQIHSLVVAFLALGVGTGCITVYQPLVSLQRPVVVDPQAGNFDGAKMRISCAAGEEMPPQDAEILCRDVGTLFRNQGAQVEAYVPRNGREGADAEGGKPDLVVEVRSRKLHEENSALLRVLSVLTFTLVPTIDEHSYAQDVTIRDASGFVLAADSLQSRFIEYFGAGIWAANWLADIFVRPEADKLTGDVAKKDFSRDFYGQLSQLAFNAQVRAKVLRGFGNSSPARAGAQ